MRDHLTPEIGGEAAKLSDIVPGPGAPPVIQGHQGPEELMCRRPRLPLHSLYFS